MYLAKACLESITIKSLKVLAPITIKPHNNKIVISDIELIN